MTEIFKEENSLMKKIVSDYGQLIKTAVFKASCGYPNNEDIIIDIYFALVLAFRKYGAEWRPPRSFIVAVVRNKVNDFLREKYRQKNGLEEIKKLTREKEGGEEEVLSKIQYLSHREFQVFSLLGLGMTNTEIAKGLFVSLETVRSHIKKVRFKCGIRDRARLSLLANKICHQKNEEDLT